MTEVQDDLRAAKALIDTPEKFGPLGEFGAIWKIAGRHTERGHAAMRAYEDAARTHGIPQSHAEIMALFDKASE